MKCFMSIFTLLCVLYYTQATTNLKARIESCSGCSLNRLPDVRKFIFEDVPKYTNVEFKSITGAPPELVILQNDDAEVERIKLAALSRKECNDLLIEKGFRKKLNEL